MDFNLDKIIGGIKIEGVNPYAEAEEELWSDVPLWIPTGCISLDYAIGGYKRGFRGGIPIGKAIEINGMESSCKSALLQHIIRETLAIGGAFFLCDSENAHDEQRMKLIGADLTNFRFIQKPKGILTKEESEEVEEIEGVEEGEEPEGKKGGFKKKQKIKSKPSWPVTLEDFFDIAEETVFKFRKSVPEEVPLVIALDSLAAIKTKRQMAAKEFSQRDILDTSIVMESRFGRFCGKVTAANAAVVLINQLRSRPGENYGDPLYSNGGNAKNFFFSLRIRMGSSTQIKMEKDIGRTQEEYLNEDVAGMQGKGQVVKNKVAEPWRKFRFPFYFDYRGIWDAQCFAQLVIDREKFRFSNNLERKSKKGSGEGQTYFWKGKEIGKGEEGLTLAFDNDPGLRNEMEQVLFLDEEG